MDLQTLLAPLQTALVPVVLSSTCGLLCLLVQSRYSRITDRIRRMLKENPPPADALESMFKRARYSKWSLFGLFCGVSCFLTLSFVILISLFFPSSLVQMTIIVAIFILGMVSLLLGLWFEVLELAASFDNISQMYRIYKKKAGGQQKLQAPA